MTCLEMLILETVLLALMIYEKLTVKKHILKEEPYYKIEPKTH